MARFPSIAHCSLSQTGDKVYWVKLLRKLFVLMANSKTRRYTEIQWAMLKGEIQAASGADSRKLPQQFIIFPQWVACMQKKKPERGWTGDKANCKKSNRRVWFLVATGSSFLSPPWAVHNGFQRAASSSNNRRGIFLISRNFNEFKFTKQMKKKKKKPYELCLLARLQWENSVRLWSKICKKPVDQKWKQPFFHTAKCIPAPNEAKNMC